MALRGNTYARNLIRRCLLCDVCSFSVSRKASVSVARKVLSVTCYHTCNNTFVRLPNVIDYIRVRNFFVIERMLILKAIKYRFKRSYDKQNLTLVIISYEILYFCPDAPNRNIVWLSVIGLLFSLTSPSDK